VKAYYEFEARDRPEGWNLWMALNFSPATPEPKRMPVPQPQWNNLRDFD
jgi:hypothetical protein